MTKSLKKVQIKKKINSKKKETIENNHYILVLQLYDHGGLLILLI